MVAVTDTNRSPIIGILALLFAVISTLSGAARLGIKYAITRNLTVDDHLISVSMAFSVLQTVCITIAARNGYGEAESASSQERIDIALKVHHPFSPDEFVADVVQAVYAAEMLYVASLTFSKLSSLAFMTFLMQRTRKAEWVLIAIISAWAVAAEFAVAFQCNLPQPWRWNQKRCFNRDAWWMVFGAFNILSEGALILVPSMLILRIQMAVPRKIVATACFLTRFLVIVAIILELVYRQQNNHASDPLLAIWKAAVCVQLVQCLSIVMACAPHLKPFMDGLQSTGLRLYHLPGETSGRGEYARVSKAKAAAHELSGLVGVANSTAISAGREQQDWDDTMSHSSQDHIIRETRTWVVEEQYNPDAATNRPTDSESNGSHGPHESTSH
ncbi:hypothetical protein AAWM_07885 [Aspergillus awamori]|uniref:Rhodopsin domain-containing protein n=1 Tax=Aspergillus awamori TaxID=105351 RepID=A0A401L0F7_ASPAW|nr:hypothetical protein AAWM_07885 [Aspergillus awamori]